MIDNIHQFAREIFAIPILSKQEYCYIYEGVKVKLKNLSFYLLIFK